MKSWGLKKYLHAFASVQHLLSYLRWYPTAARNHQVRAFNFQMLPNWNATDTMRKQILFANYHIRKSGTGLTTLGSYLIILTHASSNIWLQPKRQSVLLLKRSICLCTSLNWTEFFKWCSLRKVFRTSSFFLRPKMLAYRNSLQLEKNL